MEHSFRAFADRVPESGVIVANADDANTMHTLEGGSGPSSPSVWSRATSAPPTSPGTGGCPPSTWCTGGCVHPRGPAGARRAQRKERPGRRRRRHRPGGGAGGRLRGPGRLPGAGRRFEHKGTYHGAEVYDDYAHHPGELHALLSAARTLGYERVICAFQPHTYTRTHALFNDFVEALRAPDITLLAEIYAAREVNDIGISSKDLAARIPGSEYYATLPEVTERLRALARPGDPILTVGAGDIFTVGEALLREG